MANPIPKEIDPAVRLLLTAGEDAGKRALLVMAGSGELAAAFAPRFSEVVCHNVNHALHASALETAGRLRLGNVQCVLGDLPCSDREEEGFLPGIRFPEKHFDLVVFRLGRGTAQLNAVLVEAFRLLVPGGSLLVCGHNQEGIKSFAKRGEGHFGNLALQGLKASCRLLRFRKESEAPVAPVEDPRYFLPVRLELAFPGGTLEYLTKPGIFAYRATDAGTALLARHLPSCAGKTVLDLGCGSGALSLAAFRLGAADVLATDNSAIATACAERNFALNRMPGRTLCSDLAEGAAGGEFDLILTNPPFHNEAETDYSLPGRILQTLLRLLKPGGEAYLVANQFLDYSAPAEKLFRESAILAREQGYTIHRMVKAA
ncbi:MAG TPA: methyltransferase [Fibrobacteria bacterium]|nr:methyltransferase [Fibrobacteria bacterium]